MYAIIDIETTGGNSRFDKITEVAIYKHDGEKVVDEFVSLINPECKIPYYITELTGINDSMVRTAPKFYEVAKRIVQITEGCTFVAHNAKFDYNFIHNEFKQLGYDYHRNTLCSVRLSRHLLPGHSSYSLGKLCRDLGIEITARHRAAGDALATVKLFEMLLQKDGNHFQKRTKKEREALKALEAHPLKHMLADLPQKAGVYYLYNAESELIYVGKSLNIRSRVTNHLANYNNKKAMAMTQTVADIKCEVTGSELVALLKESEEIKKYKPIFNRAQLRSSYQFGLFAEYELDGYLHLTIGKLAPRSNAITTFTGREEARSYIEQLVVTYNLCRKLSGLFDNHGPCFHYGIRECNGACVGKENPDEYNARAKEAISALTYEHPSFVVIDQGREPDELAIVVVENGRYLGYGYLHCDKRTEDVQQLKNCITPSPDNRDVQNIIKGFLERNEVDQIITYEPKGATVTV